MRLSIFISSPGDVAEERQLVRQVILELSHEPEFETIDLNAVSWDDPHGRTPLVAQIRPQTAVERGLPRPSQCDVVVGVFWARLGSPLPIEEYRKPDGNPFLSGTEYEIDDALRATDGPDVLLYRRDEEPLWGARDPEREHKQEQLERLDRYIDTLRAEDRYIAFYPTPADFKEHVKNDLRRVLAARLRMRRGSGNADRDAALTPVANTSLSTALPRLAAMPLDAVPSPAPLPSRSHVALARHAMFIGRDSELRAIAEAMRSEPLAVGAALAITGLGGVGKTQLASEFVHRYGQYFMGGVFWLSFADPLAIPAHVATCGGPAGLDLRPGFGDLPLDDQVRLVVADWQGPLPRLLVFDGCEDEALLSKWRPLAGAGRVLVTSRREIWTPALGIRQLRLGGLARLASVMLLRNYRDGLDAHGEILDEIAEELGNLPIALHLSGSYLARYQYSELGQPARYLERLRRADLPAVCGVTERRQELHVGRTFALSYERLNPADAIDASAQRTLARAACFAAGEPIPRRLLRASAGIEDQDEDAVQGFEEGILRLRELGLIAEGGDGRLVLHRLLAAFVRGRTADLSVIRTEVEAAVLAEARGLNEAGQPSRLLAWQPHLRRVAERAADAGSEHAGDLLNSLGYHLDTVADFAGAEAAYRRMLTIDETRFGSWHPEVAIALNNLGSALHGRGDLQGAQAAYERALAIDEEAYGPEHPKVAIRISNLGLLRQELGDLEGAKRAFERALAIDERAYASDSPEVASDVSNLGRVLRQQHDLVGARAAFERALAISEKTLRPDHPNLAIYVNNLGSVLQDLGDLAGARAAYERALAIDERVYGADHVRTATRINNLGSVLHAEGRFEGARAAYERALAIFERRLGPEHPNTRKVRGHLRSLAETPRTGEVSAK